MRTITIKDFHAGQTACMVTDQSYTRNPEVNRIQDVAVTKTGRKYVTIGDAWERKFEAVGHPYLSIAGPSDGWDHKLFLNRKDAEEYIENRRLLTEIRKQSQMTGDLPTETLRLILALLRREENQEISGMWTISTAHIRKSTARYLDQQINDADEGYGLPVYQKSEFGWLIAVDPFLTSDEEAYVYVPEELANILKTAASMGCAWVCLDADGSRVENLPVYDWTKEEEDE